MKRLMNIIHAALGRVKYGFRASTELEVFIFSKDRAPQLDLLLRTYIKHSKPGPRKVTIQFAATDDRHRRAYNNLLDRHRDIIAESAEEQQFESTLVRLLSKATARNVMFLVDDIVFIRDFNIDAIADWDTRKSILSLRLGRNITRSFNRGNSRQTAPAFKSVCLHGQEMLTWHWNRAEVDWAMPTALDGNVLPLAEVLPLLAGHRIKGPNSLEQVLGQYRFFFKYRMGACFPLSCLVNLPLNTVKREQGFNFPNLMIDNSVLLENYLIGRHLSIHQYSGLQPDSCHMEWIPEWSVSLEPSLAF